MIRATVHHDCLWINGHGLNMARPELKWLCKLLLDNGVEVRGYWKDVDYAYIDERISSKDGRA